MNLLKQAKPRPETELQKAVRLLKLLIKKTQEESVISTLSTKLEPEEFVELMSFLYNIDPEWLNELKNDR